MRRLARIIFLSCSFVVIASETTVPRTKRHCCNVEQDLCCPKSNTLRSAICDCEKIRSKVQECDCANILPRQCGCSSKAVGCRCTELQQLYGECGCGPLYYEVSCKQCSAGDEAIRISEPESQCCKNAPGEEILTKPLKIQPLCAAQCMPLCDSACLQQASLCSSNCIEPSQAQTNSVLRNQPKCVDMCMPQCSDECIQRACVPACQPMCDEKCISQAESQIVVIPPGRMQCARQCMPSCDSKCIEAACVPACQPMCEDSCVEAAESQILIPHSAASCPKICQPNCSSECVHHVRLCIAACKSSCQTACNNNVVCVNACLPSCEASCTQQNVEKSSVAFQSRLPCPAVCQPGCTPRCLQQQQICSAACLPSCQSTCNHNPLCVEACQPSCEQSCIQQAQQVVVVQKQKSDLHLSTNCPAQCQPECTALCIQQQQICLAACQPSCLSSCQENALCLDACVPACEQSCIAQMLPPTLTPSFMPDTHKDEQMSLEQLLVKRNHNCKPNSCGKCSACASCCPAEQSSNCLSLCQPHCHPSCLRRYAEGTYQQPAAITACTQPSNAGTERATASETLTSSCICDRGYSHCMQGVCCLRRRKSLIRA